MYRLYDDKKSGQFLKDDLKTRTTWLSRAAKFETLAEAEMYQRHLKDQGDDYSIISVEFI